jgi:L-histidine N-alpha-methyltransferase
MPQVAQLRIDVHLTRGDRRATLAADVRRGLTSQPKELPAKWFYDDRGSLLFEEITRLPEYYLTRRERSILVARAREIAEAAGADTLVELGSGSAEKTTLLLDALRGTGELRRYVPFDVSKGALLESAEAVALAYRGLEVHGVVGDFERHLDSFPPGGRRLVAFLGSSLGNLVGAVRVNFLETLRIGLEPGDSFLLGADLVKDPARLVPAYDDSAGVTADFNKNVLSVVNNELGGTFDLETFEHVARWDPVNEWIDIRVRSLADQTVLVDDLGLRVSFEAGEEMRTEISAKFRRERLERELGDARFELARWWTDPDGDFSLSLWTAV